MLPEFKKCFPSASSRTLFSFASLAASANVWAALAFSKNPGSFMGPRYRSSHPWCIVIIILIIFVIHNIIKYYS
jgi:hypothetical protein